MDGKKYQIALFGKTDCPKCDAVKKRIAKILDKDEFAAFEMNYININTAKGLVEYAKADTINGQRIPTIQIKKLNYETNLYEKIQDPRKQRVEDGRLIVPTNLQLETDYSDVERAVIKPKHIEDILRIAMNGIQ